MVKDNNEQRRLMLTEPMGKLLFKLSLPSVIIQLITIVYNTADTFFVAKLNNSASAAVGVVFSLMAVIQALGFGIGMGANSLISMRLGAKREDEAAEYASSAIAAGVIMGAVILTLGLIFIEPIMVLIGASETALPYAVSYGTYILIAAPVMCSNFVLNCILRSEGQNTLSMIGMCSGGIINMFLDPVLIFWLDMGIAGAAVATMVSQIISLLILSSFFIRGKSIVKLSFRKISRRARVYGLIIRMGIPTIFRQGMASIASALINRNMLIYGDAAVAAITISNKIYMLVRNIVLGIGQGYQPIAGYCYGAGNHRRVKKAFWLASLAGTVICVGLSAAVFFLREGIISLFRDDADVIAVGSEALRVLAFSMPMLAYSTYVNQTYQSLGFSFGATFLASCRQGIFFIPLSFILPKLLGIFGVQLLQPSADAVTFLVSIPFQIYFFRKHLTEENNTDT